MDSLFVVIPAYNERDNVETLIRDWYPVLELSGMDRENSRLVVIDDGSKDDTLQVLQSLAKDRPGLTVLTKPNGGHGDTLLFGYRYAVEQGADWVFQTDSDGQTNAGEFSDFWKDREQYDAIFGSRAERGDGASRKFVENVLCLILSIVFGVRVPDANCPFRLMRSEKVDSYIRRLPEHYALPNVMLTVFFAKNGDRICFRNITFENRKGGKNSINVKKIVKIGFQSISDFISFRKNMR